jgi:predicted 3-demethylubiquinone-9 3-methyltransferase (glyoxalase superfamily)
VVPSILGQLFAKAGKEASGLAVNAMLKMKKMDLNALQEGFEN